VEVPKQEETIMIGQLKTVVLDAPDIAGLSAFYTALAGWTQRYADDEWVTLTTDDGWRIGLQHAPDHIPPRWPDPQHPQQAHLDFRVPDLDVGTKLGRRSRCDSAAAQRDLAHLGRPRGTSL
jgi:catechol-2,3-dioxygenase